MRGLLVDPQRLLRLANSGTGRTLDAQLRPVFPSCVSLGLFRVRESYRTLDAGRCFVVVGLFVAAHVVLVVSEALLSAESFSALETLERPEIRVLVVQVTAVGDFRGEHGVALVADHPGAALGLDRGLARDSRLELFDVVLLVLGGVRVDGGIMSLSWWFLSWTRILYLLLNPLAQMLHMNGKDVECVSA